MGTTESTILQYQGGLVVGVFDITPYLQSGVNTLAVHVTAPTSGEALVGLESLSTSMIADVLFNDSQGHQTWLLPDDTSHATSWHASPRFIDGWMQGAAKALAGQFQWLSVDLAQAAHFYCRMVQLVVYKQFHSRVWLLQSYYAVAQ